MQTSSYGDGGNVLDGAYKPLPSLYLAFMLIWYFSAVCWTVNTYKNRHFQPNKLQWMLAFVPWTKSLHLTLSFLFWYTCLSTNICSLWISFGAYITSILFQTSAFTSFFLISHGYCITCNRLSIIERRKIAVVGSVLYLTLVGYRASVPYFSVILMLDFFVVFYVIFYHISQNLLVLRDQLSFIDDQDVQAMRDATHTKYVMFKKFQGAMHVVAVFELALFINVDNSLDSYWIRLMVREWAQFVIFLYIGWIFRCQDFAPRFSFMPTMKSKHEQAGPPIYSIEMDAATFKEFTSREWQIGLPTRKGSLKDSVLVVIQQPHS